MKQGRELPRLLVALVGGGAGSVIGSSHRLAMRLTERFDLVAGAFDVDAARGREFARSLHISEDRIYGNVESLIAAERKRPDPVDLVCVLTPNHTHFGIAKPLVEAGFNVMCEKPLTTRSEDAVTLADLVARKGTLFAMMYGYTGYPMVRHARDLIRSGRIGRIRLIHSEFSLGTPSTLQEDPQGHWRTKPGLSGESAVIGMVGTHALHLSTFVTGLELKEVSADCRTYVEGRLLEDNANMLLRFSEGATGMMWNSYVAAGTENGLRVRIYGETGGLEWNHVRPNELDLLTPGKPRQILTLASREPVPGMQGVSIAAVQPEGFVEAFANVYRDVADAIEARSRGDSCSAFPDITDGALGVRFVSAAIRSSRDNARWTRL
ncbi:MAG: Gfo/Idh/MocA family oxidoreductase [Mesorhizobium sp.]|uniref:Gfo/Idh/MocA family protein n=1 Tax=Mesorhizobium sp. TaxID=1871066 RepID=UPI000FE9A32B|nr:Gfo/Idh/MocA family oxidoreductase [Mesorhizobium sp.]RWL17937.1 MAG: Gfo/Idh/MocA family oxidoreductase [Mesorhizobium sp.]